MFLATEAVRLAIPEFAHAIACDGCPPLTDLLDRYEKAGGRFLVCPICFDARKLDNGTRTATPTYCERIDGRVGQ